MKLPESGGTHGGVTWVLGFARPPSLTQGPPLFTVSMSFRLSISCRLSLISLEATHVLIWSLSRWGGGWH